ncbi:MULTISPECIES: glycerol-3-phosphate responsive antiterminator [Prauserella salsuginis group]|uniref:Glycerol-3-phosphate responsive antiterminator n=1 Tax=Prauserella salsuginis TaxID=387889 RepID=A0ABW6G868_9PSEU|nr:MULTISPECIES: glycerol-3-phosphate responsive antiterminator [Prauserella salsuginis group]MCR3721718.1 Glycerol-3-phosphate responsive antiterminator (mRNA-binding) [Prauserella flava]MCR3734410.1 Glycerol-3-phosphate responsive antiterminator (mRNA-binding) [Prauserella salsuginis]
MHELLLDQPVIASIKDESGLQAVATADPQVTFLLYGSVLTLPDLVEQLRATGKTVLVNVDLVEGLVNRDVAVDFVAERTRADGVLSSKASIVRAAKARGLLAVHRFFLVDSFSYHNLGKQLAISKPDYIEILPGCVPRVITWIREETDVPIIAGGLVCDKDDVVAALRAGATAIASSNVGVWAM